MAEPGPEARIFVYGTLLRGQPAHHRLRHARFLGEARTAPGYHLVRVDWYPGLMAGGERSIRGELYAVDAGTLSDLDAYEDHPQGFTREAIRLADGSTALAYLLRPHLARGRPTLAADAWPPA